MAIGMQDLLSKFRAIRGVGMAVVVGSDGLVIESVHRPELDADALAAVATNGLLLAEARAGKWSAAARCKRLLSMKAAWS